MNTVLKINNIKYNDKFNFELICEKENSLYITFYALPKINLVGNSVEILINNKSIFNGFVQNCNLVNKETMMLECEYNYTSLNNIRDIFLLNKGEDLSDIIPNNLVNKIILDKDITLLEEDILGKLNVLKEELHLPYFSITKDKVNFVDFSSKARKIKNIIKAIINKTVDNFEYIQMFTQFNDDLYAGDIISYDDNLYAIETLVYNWDYKEGFTQEIHAINSELHKVRYLK